MWDIVSSRPIQADAVAAEPAWKIEVRTFRMSSINSRLSRAMGPSSVRAARAARLKVVDTFGVLKLFNPPKRLPAMMREPFEEVVKPLRIRPVLTRPAIVAQKTCGAGSRNGGPYGQRRQTRFSPGRLSFHEGVRAMRLGPGCRLEMQYQADAAWL